MNLNLAEHRREISVAAVYLALLAMLGIFRPDYFHGQLLDVCVKSAPLLVLGIGMTFVILARQIDISVGSQFSVCGVLAAVAAKQGLPMPLVALVPLIAGAIMGSLNGFLVGFVQLPSIVVTLANMVLLREGLRWIRQGAAVNQLPGGFQWFGMSQRSGIFLILAIAVLLFDVFFLLSRYLAAARSVYAVGSDYEAARLAGLQPRRVTFGVFLLMGVLTGAAALLLGVQFPSADMNAGMGMELRVIAAVVVGGTAIAGGRGTLIGTFLGTLLLGTIASSILFLKIQAQWEQAVQGIIILAAVASDSFGGSRGNLRSRKRGV